MSESRDIVCEEDDIPVDGNDIDTNDEDYKQGIDIQNVDDFKSNFKLNHMNLDYLSNFDHLNCPICKQPFINPYLTICGHCFCKDCLFECFNSLGFKCPLDRTNLNLNSSTPTSEYPSDRNINSSDSTNTEESHSDCHIQDDVFPAPIIISNILDDLKVKCLNDKRGCTWVGSRWEIKLHLLSDCSFTRFNCDECGLLVEKRFVSLNESADQKEEVKPNQNETNTENQLQQQKCPHVPFECDKCSELITSITKEDHLSNKCDKNFVDCKGCKLAFPQKAINKHENYCSKVYLNCPAQKFGCDWKGSKELLDNVHLRDCTFNKLSKYLSNQEEKMEMISSENVNLKRQIDILLDSTISGKLTNLGFPLQLEEISSDHNSFTNNFNDFFGLPSSPSTSLNSLNLNSINEETFMKLLIELSSFKKVTEESISQLNNNLTPLMAQMANLQTQIEAIQLNNAQFNVNDLNYLKLNVNSIRQQMQFLVSNDRRRRFDMANSASVPSQLLPTFKSANLSNTSNNNNDTQGLYSSSSDMDHNKLSNKL